MGCLTTSARGANSRTERDRSTKDPAEGILRGLREYVLIQSLHRHLLIDPRRSGPVVVDEQPVARVLLEAGLREAPGLPRDEVKHRLDPVAHVGASHARELPDLPPRDLLDFRPGAGSVADAVARNESAFVNLFMFRIGIDLGPVRRYGFCDLDPDAPGRHRHDEIGPFSRLQAKRELEEPLAARGGEEAARNPGFAQLGRSSLCSSGDSNVPCTQVVV